MADIKSNKSFVLILTIILILLIFILKAASLQLFDNTYRLSAENNAIRRVVEYPARGLIFDRNNKLLVYNKPIYELMVVPSQTKKFDTLELADILDTNTEFVVQKIKEAYKYSKNKPSKIFGPIDQKTYIILSERLHKFIGFYVETKFERMYPSGIGAQVLGFLREVDKVVTDTSKYYKPGDIVGESGIEKAYELYLRGQKGIHYYLVDAGGRIVDNYKNGKYDTIAVVGSDVISSLDADLQSYGELLMQNKRGSIVAIEPQTGEVLALISFPTYDPNLLTLSKLKKNYPTLKQDKEYPMFNRAIGAAMSPPGSTFKVVDAVIGLSEGVINTETVINCGGGFNIGSHIVECHHGGGIDFYRSISGSCNSFYCEVFTRLIKNPKYESFENAYRHWYDQLHKFGIGRKVGIDIPGENGGVLYSADQYNKIHGKGEWGPFKIISLAIGQGEMGLTTLQLANISCIMANKGYYYTPHLVKRIVGVPEIDIKYRTKNYVGIDSSFFTPVVDAMEQVVIGGTAAGIYIDSISQCGKTGTAQNPHGRNHSIFIAFAPKDNPQIAIAVYIENGGFGSETAAPIASLLIEKYLTDTIKRPWLEQSMLQSNLMDRGERSDKDE